MSIRVAKIILENLLRARNENIVAERGCADGRYIVLLKSDGRYQGFDYAQALSGQLGDGGLSLVDLADLLENGRIGSEADNILKTYSCVPVAPGST